MSTAKGQLTIAQVTAVLHGAAAVLLVVSAVWWLPGKNPRWVLVTMAVVATAFCLHALLRGAAFTRRECFGMLVVQQGAVVALTWGTPTDLAAFANGSVLPLSAVYAAWYLRARWARTASYSGVAAWSTAIATRDDPMLAGLSLSVVAQTVAAVEVFTRIRTRMVTVAHTDALTGALNRWGLERAVRSHLLRAGRQPLSVVVMDLDDLRRVNSTGGHRAGDDLLVGVVRHWQARLRTRDIIGRLGGDEFVVVLPGLTLAEARSVAARLAEGSPAGFSAGVASLGPDDDLDSLVERADRLMYQEKAARAA